MTTPPGPPLPPSPPDPPGLAARLQAMSIAELETFLDRIRAHTKMVNANPPAGRQADIDLVNGALNLAERVSGQRHQALQPPNADANSTLTQTVTDINSVISGGGSA